MPRPLTTLRHAQPCGLRRAQPLGPHTSGGHELPQHPLAAMASTRASQALSQAPLVLLARSGSQPAGFKAPHAPPPPPATHPARPAPRTRMLMLHCCSPQPHQGQAGGAGGQGSSSSTCAPRRRPSRSRCSSRSGRTRTPTCWSRWGPHGRAATMGAAAAAAHPAAGPGRTCASHPPGPWAPWPAL